MFTCNLGISEAWWVPVATYAPACLCLFCLSFKTQPKTANDQSEVVKGGQKGLDGMWWDFIDKTESANGKALNILGSYIFSRKATTTLQRQNPKYPFMSN